MLEQQKDEGNLDSKIRFSVSGAGFGHKFDQSKIPIKLTGSQCIYGERAPLLDTLAASLHKIIGVSLLVQSQRTRQNCSRNISGINRF